MNTEAKWCIGQIVTHIKQGYRGVVYDVDASFSESDDWYDEVAKSRPPKTDPWYRVLVDRESVTTYVAERHLQPAIDQSKIEHPLIEDYLQWCASNQQYKRVKQYS